MLTLPLHSNQITWLFRLALLLNLMVISWLAFTSNTFTVAAVFSDKVNHMFAFFVLSYCLDRGFPHQRFLLFKVVPLVAYGLAIELIQSRLPHREFSLLDLGADCIAIGLYWLLRHPMRRLLLPRQSDSIKQRG